MSLSYTATTPVEAASMERIRTSLHLEDVALNELDFEDLYVSEAVLETLKGMAGDVYQSVAGDAATLEDVSLNAFWVEKSGMLILCVRSGGVLRLLQAPEGHWKVREGGYH